VRALNITFAMLAAAFRGQMQYRVNFVLQVIFGLGYQGTGFIFIWVVLSRFQALAGWSLGQIAFLYGLRLTTHGLFVSLFGSLSELDEQIREGKFDRYLVRPLNPLLQIMATEVRVSAVGDILGGVALFLAANALVRVDWSPAAIAYFLLAIARWLPDRSGAQTGRGSVLLPHAQHHIAGLRDRQCRQQLRQLSAQHLRRRRPLAAHLRHPRRLHRLFPCRRAPGP